MCNNLLYLMVIFFIGQISWASSPCAPELKNIRNEQEHQIWKHDDASAFPKLGLTKFRNPHSPEISAYADNEKKRLINYVTLKEDGTPFPIFQELQSRLSELTPTNSPLSSTIKKGEVFIRGGNLIYKNLAGKETVLAAKITDPKTGSWQAIADFKVSPDESKVLYSYIEDNGDLNHWYVADIESGRVLSGPMDVRINDSNWSLNSKAVYYTRWASEEERAQGLYYTHNYRRDLVTGKESIIFVPPQKDSHEIYAMEDFTDKTGTERFIAYRVQASVEIPLGVYIGERGQAGEGEFQVGFYKWKPLRISKKNRLGKFITTHHGQIILRSTEVGNNFGLVSVDPLTLNTTTLVKSNPNEVMFSAQRINKFIFTQYFNQKTLKYSVKVYDLNGNKVKDATMESLGLSGMGGFSAFQGSLSSDWSYFSFSTATTPPTTFKIDTRSMRVERIADSRPVNFDAKKVFESTEYVQSPTGTIVPIEIYKRNDGTKPLFNYVFFYGYIGTMQSGWWNLFIQSALELGGMVTVAHITGGGDGGRDGQVNIKDKRLDSVAELGAVADYIREKHKVSFQILSGRSFGGLQTFMNYVHDGGKFDIYLPVVPVTDINEFFNRTPFGPFALDDFGATRNETGQVEDTDQFRTIISKFSPLQSLDKVTTPKPIVFFVSDHDERVTPQQGLAAAYALQSKHPNFPSIYVYQTLNNGHVGRTEQIWQMAFIAKYLGIKNLSPLKLK